MQPTRGGIPPSEDFLYGYIAVSATLMVLTLGVRLMIRHAGTGTQPSTGIPPSN